MSATATMKVEFMCGDDIEDCFTEAIRIANQLHVTVEFDFNGVSCYAKPYTKPKDGVSAYHSIREIEGRPKMAFS